jgi:hypothetical protein
MVSKVSADQMTLWVKLAGTVGVAELAASSNTRTRASARRWAGVRARWSFAGVVAVDEAGGFPVGEVFGAM